jgi:hypothetical protein
MSNTSIGGQSNSIMNGPPSGQDDPCVSCEHSGALSFVGKVILEALLGDCASQVKASQGFPIFTNFLGVDFLLVIFKNQEAKPL